MTVDKLSADEKTVDKMTCSQNNSNAISFLRMIS